MLKISMTTLLLVSGCGLAASESVLCERTADDTDAHTEALIADGGPMSQLTGARLISKLDAGCDR